jgi:hypothetical protein
MRSYTAKCCDADFTGVIAQNVVWGVRRDGTWDARPSGR